MSILFQNKFSLSTFLLCILIFILPLPVFALKVGTYSNPPFSMNEDGENIGLATEAVVDLLKKSEIENYTIINYPLERGLYELKSGRIDIYYPYIAELEKYKDEFVLIGPISTYRVALFVRNDYKEDVSLAAMHNLMLAAERGSIGDRVLEKNHIHTEKATKELSCLNMVLAERVVACAIGTLPGMYVAALNNMSDSLRYVETGDSANIYVALRADLPPELINRIQSTFKTLKNNNYFESQQLDYERKFSVFIKTVS